MYEPKIATRAAAACNEIISCGLVLTSPVFVFFYWITYQYYNASLSDSAVGLYSEGPIAFFLSRAPRPTRASITVYLTWVLCQVLFYIAIPGPIHYGPRTCGGRRLPYKLNGLRAWALTCGIAGAASYYRQVDPAWIATHWGELIATANLYCLALIAIFYVKARVKPDNAGETLVTARQYQLHGFITNSMILAVAFRTIIVIEYFFWENWFFETLDSNHERFAFYNIYGFATMMPQLWTLQTHYLALHPVVLSKAYAAACIIAFIAGGSLNHAVNHQRSLARETAGQCRIWGSQTRFIKATYRTEEGKMHTSILLCSGWWGIVRHANYVGSALYTIAACAVCKNDHLFPWTEAVLVVFMIGHRCLRDEGRCREKYGKSWDEYCSIVRWRMIPGIF